MKIKSLSKKGVLGIETTKAIVISLLTLGVLVIATILAITTLRDSGIFTTGSLEQNYTNQISGNISYGATNFFKNVPTFFTLLAVVVLILIIAIVIVAVSRFGGGGGRAESL